MNKINLISLIQEAEGLAQHNYRTFCDNYGIHISLSEIDDLKKLIQTLIHNGIDNNAFDHFLWVMSFHKSVMSLIYFE
ncbi:hypothetical protein [Providencia manganoxydans]|uniref:hypothetical protein n=1 Tax=Providencia manganoxydans TaxID=2923283 RepID=UPI0034E48946